jgi:urease accessory protein
MVEPGLWHLLQLSDQLFPTGAYAFSHAIETYVEQGVVHDRTSCQCLLENVCRYSLGPGDMVFCAHAFRLAAARDLDALRALDRRLTAFKIARELRQESQRTGQAFLRASLSLQPPPLVEQFLQMAQQGEVAGHHAIAFGIVTQQLGVPQISALQGYGYQVTAGWVAAALRLVPLGQTDGQRLLHDLAPILGDVIERYRDLRPEDAWTSTPGLDLRSMQHERQYSRLCRS